MRGKLMEEMDIQMEQAQLDCTHPGNDCCVAELATCKPRKEQLSKSQQAGEI